jgi:hypothetical protein
MSVSSLKSSNIQHILTERKVDRVHWLRAKAQFERWMEEQASIHNETEWVPIYFQNRADQWKKWMRSAAEMSLAGHHAHASSQMHAWEELCKSAEKALSPIRLAPLKDFKAAKLYL